MDTKLTEKIQKWLDTPVDERDIVAGATMLLQLNRNRYFYTNVVARPARYADKLEYELKKHLRIRLDGQTIQDVVRMEKTVLPAVEKTIQEEVAVVNNQQEMVNDDHEVVIDSNDDKPQEAVVAKGRREDHDSLPDEIKALFNDAGQLYFSIKQLYETLKTMENAQPCDRYEYLKQLKEADTKYHANLQKYDAYRADGTTTTVEPETETSADLAGKISTARGYLSSNKSKLAALKADKGAAEKYAALLAKMQERYDFLIANGAPISEAQTAELAELGVVTDTGAE